LAVAISIEPGSVIATIGVTYFRKAARQSQIQRMLTSLKREAASAAEAVRKRM
jgi:DNA-binding IclR family transcriptional regulator